MHLSGFTGDRHLHYIIMYKLIKFSPWPHVLRVKLVSNLMYSRFECHGLAANTVMAHCFSGKHCVGIIFNAYFLRTFWKNLWYTYIVNNFLWQVDEFILILSSNFTTFARKVSCWTVYTSCILKIAHYKYILARWNMKVTVSVTAPDSPQKLQIMQLKSLKGLAWSQISNFWTHK